MTTETDLDAPADTRVMGIVHKALRRDLIRAIEALTTAPYPFDAQRIAIAEHLQWMMRFLHRHHSSEDEYLYPLVRGRNAAAAELLESMDSDHRSIEPAMDALVSAAGSYRDSAAARQQVVEAIDKLADVLLPHLDREENEMMPIVSSTITVAEWDHWDQEYNVKPLPPLELSDSGLWIMDGLDDSERTVITDLVPAIPRWIILNIMSRRYRRAAFRRWRTEEFTSLRAPLRGRVEADVAATPEQVWAVLRDVTRVGEWSHECRSAHWLSGSSAAAVGARFRGKSKSGFMRWSRPCTITTLTPARELVWETHGGIYGDNTEWRYELEPTDSGTRIVQSFRVLSLPVWFDRLIWRMVPRHHDRTDDLRGDLSRLGELAARVD